MNMDWFGLHEFINTVTLTVLFLAFSMAAERVWSRLK